MNSVHSILAALDLTPKEIEVYLVLLQTGNAPASAIAKRVDINQSTVRYTLDHLVKKGVAYVMEKNNTHYFHAKHPSKLLDVLQLKEEQIENSKYELKSLMPELEQLYASAANLPKVRFFEGVEGIKELYRDVLAESKTIFGYSQVDSQSVHPEIYSFLQEEYVPARTKAGNAAFMIFNDDINEEYLKNDKKMQRVSMRVPLSEITFRSCFHIYANKIAFYSRSKDDLSGVLIQNKNLQHDQLMLFKMAWEYARQLPLNQTYKDVKLPPVEVQK